MSEHRRFVVGIDGSAGSRVALRWAIDEAAAWGAELDVVHAWQHPIMTVPPVLIPPTPGGRDGMLGAAEKLLHTELQRALDTAASSPVLVERLTIEGPAGPALLEVARGADLVIVGSRGHGGFSGLLLGSVSGHCLHHADCPVAVIKPGHADRGLPVVVGVDGSHGSVDALCWALTEAAHAGSSVVALAAWSWLDQPPGEQFDVNYGGDDVRAAVEEALVAARTRACDPSGVDVEIRVVNDHPSRALIDASSTARLLVVGSRGLGAIRSAVVGSVSQQCVHHAHSSVVVVKGRPSADGV